MCTLFGSTSILRQLVALYLRQGWAKSIHISRVSPHGECSIGSLLLCAAKKLILLATRCRIYRLSSHFLQPSGFANTSYAFLYISNQITAYFKSSAMHFLAVVVLFCALISALTFSGPRITPAPHSLTAQVWSSRPTEAPNFHELLKRQSSTSWTLIEGPDYVCGYEFGNPSKSSGCS